MLAVPYDVADDNELAATLLSAVESRLQDAHGSLQNARDMPQMSVPQIGTALLRWLRLDGTRRAIAFERCAALRSGLKGSAVGADCAPSNRPADRVLSTRILYAPALYRLISYRFPIVDVGRA